MHQLMCRCFQVKKWPLKKENSHTPILHVCHVSDDRKKVYVLFLIIIYFSLFALLFMDFSLQISLSLTWLNFILGHWDFIAPIIYSNAIFFLHNASEKWVFYRRNMGEKQGMISMSLEAEIYYTKPTLIMLHVFFCQWCSSFYGLLKYILVHFHYTGRCIFVN